MTRRLLAVACVAAAVALAGVAWPLARLALALRGAGARLRGEAHPPPAWPYAAPARVCGAWLSPDLVQAVLRAHEVDVAAGRARVH